LLKIQNSSAESDEFRIFSILIIEIFAILCLKPLKKCYIVWEHDPMATDLSAVMKDERALCVRERCSSVRLATTR
jgi:hypothetical protein